MLPTVKKIVNASILNIYWLRYSEYRLLVGSKEVFKIHELILYCISPIVPVMSSWPFNINVTYSFIEKFLMYPFIIIEEKSS
jgi:hypothetical protein